MKFWWCHARELAPRLNSCRNGLDSKHLGPYSSNSNPHDRTITLWRSQTCKFPDSWTKEYIARFVCSSWSERMTTTQQCSHQPGVVRVAWFRHDVLQNTCGYCGPWWISGVYDLNPTSAFLGPGTETHHNSEKNLVSLNYVRRGNVLCCRELDFDNPCLSWYTCDLNATSDQFDKVCM